MSTPERLQQLQALGQLGQWAVDYILQLTLENVRLKNELEKVRTQLQEQAQQLEEFKRQAHRQAAPFRRPESQRASQPARPGRKPGHAGVCRPMPEHIDQRIRVELDCCPRCRGAITQKQSLTQYIEEIPVVRPHVTQLVTHSGWCEHCQREVCSTHPLQTSRAGGAAAVQLGPRALALACDLNKAKGLSMRQSAAVLRDHFGLKLTAGGLALLVQRVGRCLQSEYDQTVLALRQSPVVHADETSWWVGQPGWWLWVFTTPMMTLYVVINSRAAAVAKDILGLNFTGALVSDCLSIYDDLNPLQQKCYSHHLKAISEACQIHSQGGDGYLQRCQALLRTALLVKAFVADPDTARFTRCVETLRRCANSLLDTPRADLPEEKVRLRLSKQREHLFTFLEHPQIPATNNLAERQLRPAVIARKISCGNKTAKGAAAWQTLASMAATCRQRQLSFIQYLVEQVPLARTRAPTPKIAG